MDNTSESMRETEIDKNCNILGVAKTAINDLQTLKAAYHELALLWHPDHNPENPVAQQRFKEVSDAYVRLVTGSEEELKVHQDVDEIQALHLDMMVLCVPQTGDMNLGKRAEVSVVDAEEVGDGEEDWSDEGEEEEEDEEDEEEEEDDDCVEDEDYDEGDDEVCCNQEEGYSSDHCERHSHGSATLQSGKGPHRHQHQEQSNHLNHHHSYQNNHHPATCSCHAETMEAARDHTKLQATRRLQKEEQREQRRRAEAQRLLEEERRRKAEEEKEKCEAEKHAQRRREEIARKREAAEGRRRTLFYACRCGAVSEVERILEEKLEGATLAEREREGGRSGGSLLHACVTPKDEGGNEDRVEVARRLLARKPEGGASQLDVGCVDEGGLTVLHRAADFGDCSFLELLLEDRRTHLLLSGFCLAKGWSPLHYAAGAGSPSCVEALLKRGAPVGARSSPPGSDERGETALEVATRLLASAGSRVDFGDERSDGLAAAAVALRSAAAEGEKLRMEKEQRERMAREAAERREQQKTRERLRLERQLLERKQMQLREREEREARREAEEEARLAREKAMNSNDSGSVAGMEKANGTSSSATGKKNKKRGSMSAKSGSNNNGSDGNALAAANAAPTSKVDDLTVMLTLSFDDMLAHLLTMGFGEQHVRRAISQVGCDLNSLLSWLVEHPEATPAPTSNGKATTASSKGSSTSHSKKKSSGSSQGQQQGGGSKGGGSGGGKATAASAHTSPEQTEAANRRRMAQEEARRINKQWNATLPLRRAEEEEKIRKEKAKKEHVDIVRRVRHSAAASSPTPHASSPVPAATPSVEASTAAVVTPPHVAPANPTPKATPVKWDAGEKDVPHVEPVPKPHAPQAHRSRGPPGVAHPEQAQQPQPAAAQQTSTSQPQQHQPAAPVSQATPPPPAAHHAMPGHPQHNGHGSGGPNAYHMPLPPQHQQNHHGGHHHQQLHGGHHGGHANHGHHNGHHRQQHPQHHPQGQGPPPMQIQPRPPPGVPVSFAMPFVQGGPPPRPMMAPFVGWPHMHGPPPPEVVWAHPHGHVQHHVPPHVAGPHGGLSAIPMVQLSSMPPPPQPRPGPPQQQGPNPHQHPHQIQQQQQQHQQQQGAAPSVTPMSAPAPPPPRPQQVPAINIVRESVTGELSASAREFVPTFIPAPPAPPQAPPAPAAVSTTASSVPLTLSPSFSAATTLDVSSPIISAAAPASKDTLPTNLWGGLGGSVGLWGGALMGESTAASLGLDSAPLDLAALGLFGLGRPFSPLKASEGAGQTSGWGTPLMSMGE